SFYLAFRRSKLHSTQIRCGGGVVWADVCMWDGCIECSLVCSASAREMTSRSHVTKHEDGFMARYGDTRDYASCWQGLECCRTCFAHVGVRETGAESLLSRVNHNVGAELN